MTWSFLSDDDALILSVPFFGGGAFCDAWVDGDGDGDGCVSGSSHLSFNMHFFFSFVLAVVFLVSTFTFRVVSR